jgi:hypothetical protein
MLRQLDRDDCYVLNAARLLPTPTDKAPWQAAGPSDYPAPPSTTGFHLMGFLRSKLLSVVARSV